MRIAAAEAQGPNELTSRMHTVLNDLAQRNVTGSLAELAIALARSGFVAVDEPAKATGNSTAELLDAVELEALEDTRPTSMGRHGERHTTLDRFIRDKGTGGSDPGGTARRGSIHRHSLARPVLPPPTAPRLCPSRAEPR
jgi:hypothetical protein